MTTQPAGEHHTGTLDLAGQGNPEPSPISDDLVNAAAEHMHSVEQTYFGPQTYAPHIAQMLARNVLEAAYPAIRQQVAEQIAAELRAEQADPENRPHPERIAGWNAAAERVIEIGGRA